VYEKKVKCVSQFNVDPAGWRGGGGGIRNGLLNGWNSGRAPAQGREGSPAADRFKGGAQVRFCSLSWCPLPASTVVDSVCQRASALSSSPFRR
jgi:hypothetical protein